MKEMRKKCYGVRLGLFLLCSIYILLNLTGCNAQHQEGTSAGTGSEVASGTTIYAEDETGNHIQSSGNAEQLRYYQSKGLDIGVSCNFDLLVTGDSKSVYLAESEFQYDTETGRSTMIYRVVLKQGESETVKEIYSCQQKVAESLRDVAVGERIIDIEACDDGNVVIMTQTVDEQGNEDYYLKWIEPTGVLRNEIRLSQASDPRGGLTETAGGMAWIDANAGIVEMHSGESQWSPLGEITEASAMGSLRNKTLWAKARTGESPSAWQLYFWDEESAEWNEIELPISKDYYTNISSGQKCGYDFLFWNSQQAVGWNMGDAKTTELINFIASDIYFDELNQLVPLGEECFLIVTDINSGNGKMAMLERTEDMTANQRTILEIGCLGIGEDMMSWIKQFNIENDDVKILLRDYSQYQEYSQDPSLYDSGKDIEQLKLDVISGNAPDLFLISSRFPEKEMIASGAFEDLYLWLDQDEELTRSDFLENVLDAYSTDGCLYEMPLGFRVDMYAAKTSIVGEPDYLSLDALQELSIEYPESQILSSYIYRDEFLSSVIGSGLFVDEVKGECSFDSEEFVEILQLARNLQDRSNSSTKEWPRARYDQVLISKANYITSFYSFQRVEEYTYGDEVSFFGLVIPSKGMITDGRSLLAMSSQTSEKEAAWKFLRYFWGEEYQTSFVDSWDRVFPVRISALEDMKQKSTQRDEGADNSYRLNGTEVTIPTMTAEQIERYADYLFRVDTRYNLNYDIYNIVLEETSAFFEGPFDAEKVAENIQRRVQLYVWEKQ